MSPNLAHWVSSWNLISFYAHEKSHKNCFESHATLCSNQENIHYIKNILISKFWISFFTLTGLALFSAESQAFTLTVLALFSAESQAFGGSWGGAWSFCGSVWTRHGLAPDSVRWHTLISQCASFSFFALYYCFPFVLLFFPLYSGFYCIIHKKKLKITKNHKWWKFWIFCVLVSLRFYLEPPTISQQINYTVIIALV